MQHDSNVIAFPAPARAPAAAATRQTADIPSVVRFSSPEVARRGQAIMRRISEAEQLAALAGGVSADIALNEKLRDLRKDAWRRSATKVRFLRSQITLFDETKYAQQIGIAEARGFPIVDEVERFRLVENWRSALIDHLLTPAPTVADLAWKRQKAASLSPYDWVGATPEQVEKAVASDETFLRSFPARHSPNRPK